MMVIIHKLKYCTAKNPKFQSYVKNLPRMVMMVVTVKQERKIIIIIIGIAYGPIMASTRKVYEKKLQNMLEGNVLNLNGSAENGNGMSLNGNASNGLRTPSRETSHEKSPMVKLGLQQQEGTPQKDGQREVIF
jgi:hypothetical protein